jgi:general secretion pathway protein G
MVLANKQTGKTLRRVEVEWVRAAFTLMEMLVVVAIIVALAGLGGYYFLGQYKESQKNMAKTQVKVLGEAVEQYMMNHGSRPPARLEDLLVKDQQGGPYLKTRDVLIDPWGNPYQYNPNAQNPDTGEQEPEVFTTAPDGTLISNLRRNR